MDQLRQVTPRRPATPAAARYKRLFLTQIKSVAGGAPMMTEWKKCSTVGLGEAPHRRAAFAGFATFIEEIAMFKHILIPTELAAEIGARVTAYYGLDPMPAPYYGDGYTVDARAIADIERSARASGEKALAKIAQAAKASNVPFTGVINKPTTPYDGIIAAAKKNKCDVIFMSSHGRRGLAGLVLGSVTNKVLSHSKIPVLVYR
jgi:nucleotide-binding universal stress UspA family protein